MPHKNHLRAESCAIALPNSDQLKKNYLLRCIFEYMYLYNNW